MAENQDGQEKTEEPTQDRREEFRGKGQVAVSREVTGVMVLGGVTLFLSAFISRISGDLMSLFGKHFILVKDLRISNVNLSSYIIWIWSETLKLIFPVFLVTMSLAILITFSQTRLNWSWKRLAPDFGRMNPLKGLKNMVNTQALVNLLKGIGKTLAVSLVAYLILYSEIKVVPGLLMNPILLVWQHWGEITELLFYSVCALLMLIGAGDFIFNYFSLENQMKMTKQEVKDEMKKHEVDPHVKGRLKRMQRDLLFGKTLRATRDATVLITNPTHISVALKYEFGMGAPVVVAKGEEELAMLMREIAKEEKIPLMENKPLARFLYKAVEVGQEIPESVYRAVSEIIRYVFKLKGHGLRKKESRA